MPIDLGTYLTFLVTAGIIVLSPGPDTLLIIRYSIASGRTVGLATVAGVQAGLLVHTLLAIFGVSIIIASSELLFKGVAILGALYLGYIGLQSFLKENALQLDDLNNTLEYKKAFRDGMLTNLLNPKVIILFLALLPNFIDLEQGNTTQQLIFLALGLVVINVIWQVPIALAAGSFRKVISHPRIQRWIAHTTGGVLLLFAVMMLREHVLR